MRTLPLLTALLISALRANAEDWTTTDGRIYLEVKIEKQDAVSVHISDSDGGATVPLAILPPELQKKLGYDPEKAAAFEKVQKAKDEEFIREQAGLQKKAVSQLKALIAQSFSGPIDSAVLYSLEPWDRPKANEKNLHGFKILGQTPLDPAQAKLAAGVIEKAAEDWNGMTALCFNPRHALRITAKGHVCDFLICFECQGVEFYDNDKAIDEGGVTGSPDFLNSLLTAAHVTLSQSGVESPEKLKAEQQKQKEEDDRWFAAMPKSVQAKWNWSEMRSSSTPDVSLLRGAILREYPETAPRILKLLEWYGSGAGPWTGYGCYEDAPSLLLFDYPTPTILDAIHSTTLDDAQIEGAARFFAGWDFSRKRPKDLALLPDTLKSDLLKHSSKGTDADKADRAKHAFHL